MATKNKTGKKNKNTRLFESSPIDIVFFALVVVILAIGLVMLMSASHYSSLYKYGDSYHEIKKQIVFAAIGFVVMYIASKVNYRILRFLALPLYVVSLGMLVAVLLVGTGKTGEKRWINLGFTTFQPSEIAKLALIIFLAWYITKYGKEMHKFIKGLVIPGIFVVAYVGLIIIEPHLSGAIIIALVGLTLMVVGGTKLFYLFGLGGAVGGIGFIILSKTHYMQQRINIWLHPEADPLGGGFQVLQALYAIGSGGLFGLGVGNSRQKRLYIPEPQNDYIFPIVCEELGFIGALLIITLFVLLIYRGFVIAMKAPDRFGALLCYGIVARVAYQVLLNIMVVTNTLPPTGISLPFFSAGGTALVILMAEMGLVLSVSRQARLEKG